MRSKVWTPYRRLANLAKKPDIRGIAVYTNYKCNCSRNGDFSLPRCGYSIFLYRGECTSDANKLRVRIDEKKAHLTAG